MKVSEDVCFTLKLSYSRKKERSKCQYYCYIKNMTTSVQVTLECPENQFIDGKRIVYSTSKSKILKKQPKSYYFTDHILLHICLP